MAESEKDFYATVGSEAPNHGGYAQLDYHGDDVTEGATLKDVSRWGVINNSQYYGVPASASKMDPGVYTCHHSSQMGYYMSKKRNDTDTLLQLPDNASQEVIDEIAEFQTKRPDFDRLGLLYKRGILLYGPPGSGKTTTIQLLIRKVINEMGGVALYADHPSVAAECLQLLRQIEPKRQVVMLLEDLDALVREYGESGYLSLLDGEHQVDNIIFIGTTNYPEKLDKRFVDRPSRFDTVKFIGMPNAASRELFFKTKDPTITKKELKFFVESTSGFSIAHLREMVVLTRAFGRDPELAIARLEAMTKRHPTSDDDPGKKKIGFVSKNDNTEDKKPAAKKPTKKVAKKSAVKAPAKKATHKRAGRSQGKTRTS